MTMVCDDIAHRLEHNQLWRRAADRWLALLASNRFDHDEREWLRQRRNYCNTMMARTSRKKEKLGVTQINKAAGKTLARMGISQPPGDAFRRSAPAKTRADANTPGLPRRRVNDDLFT